jgi:hypothetical protein
MQFTRNNNNSNNSNRDGNRDGNRYPAGRASGAAGAAGAAGASGASGASGADGASTLVLWDSTSVLAGVTKVLGAMPSPQQRPDMGAVLDWARAAGGRCDAVGFADVFANRGDGSGGMFRRFLDALVAMGYSLVTNRTDTADTPVLRDAMAAFLTVDAVHYDRVVVGADVSDGLVDALAGLVARGVEVTVACVTDDGGWPAGVRVIGVNDIDGAVRDDDYLTVGTAGATAASTMPTRTSLPERLTELPEGCTYIASRRTLDTARRAA